MTPSHSTLFFLLLLLATTILSVDITANPDLNSKLKLAATNLDRLNLLSKDSDWAFKFDSQKTYTFNPGSVVNANAATFPALTGIDMTLAILNLGPCAMLPPHMHPRATNLVVAIRGNTTSWMVNENGARTVEVNLLPFVMTVFPKGSLHTMQNNGMFVAGPDFSSLCFCLLLHSWLLSNGS
jgi:hypothetical protein